LNKSPESLLAYSAPVTGGADKCQLKRTFIFTLTLYRFNPNNNGGLYWRFLKSIFRIFGN